MRKYVVVLILYFIGCSVAMAAPKSRYWALWDKYNAQSELSINHQIWQGILDQYLIDTADGQSRLFLYGKVTVQDKQQLEKYIASLVALDPREYQKAEQKAYWLNLYNALTVDLILKNYPISSITTLGSWYSSGPWDEEITRIAGEPVTLNDIEHRILRPLWQDNRVHYGLNCASLGCPDLSHQAFTVENTNEQLDELAERFINQKKGLEIQEDTLWLSKIYSWYASDFGPGQKGLMQHLMRYVNPQKHQALSQFSGSFKYQYNWDLNDGTNRPKLQLESEK
ncbi:MAG: DUF547 domain-containing protein [Gammaproteobacteria bacterium]|nr:DUF547 domain-containing protein [Gammaproteobacteria bacterium]